MFFLKFLIETNFVGGIVHFPVIPNPFFEEVCFTIEANIFHKVKWIFGVPNRGLTNLFEKAVRYILDVFSHFLRVHTNEITWECVNDETLFNFNRFFNN